MMVESSGDYRHFEVQLKVLGPAGSRGGWVLRGQQQWFGIAAFWGGRFEVHLVPLWGVLRGRSGKGVLDFAARGRCFNSSIMGFYGLRGVPNEIVGWRS